MFPNYARWMTYIYVTCKTVGVRLLKLKIYMIKCLKLMNGCQDLMIYLKPNV